MWSTEVIFWGLGLALLSALIVCLITWLRNRNITTKWYDWLIGSIGVLLLLYTIQNLYGSLAEREITAAWMMLLVFGLPSLILIIISAQLVLRRNRTA